MIANHMLRPEKYLAKLPLDELAKLDAFELNGKDSREPWMEGQIRAMAASVGKPLTGGSDAHVWAQMGARLTIVPGHEVTLEAVRTALRAGTTRVQAKPDAVKIVEMCGRHKRIAKARSETTLAASGSTHTKHWRLPSFHPAKQALSASAGAAG